MSKFGKRLWVMTLVMTALVLMPLAARADNVQNDVTAGGNDTITAGGSTTVNYRIHETGSDGCNASDGSAAIVTITAPTDVTATPSSLTFTSCGSNQPVVFSSDTEGDYVINVSVSDSGGGTYNTNPARFTLRVLPTTDSTPPVITPNVAGTLGNNGWYRSDVTVSWMVEDDESPISSSNGCGSTTIDSDTAGTTLTCTATSAGGTAEESVTIKRDATAPSLAPTVSPNPVLLNGSATVSANASDNLSGIVSASCGPVDTSTVGGHSVTCTATDSAGNTGSASATYSVIYNWTGFFNPVDNSVINSVKAGSAIPVKFSLDGNQGLNIFAPGYPRSQVIACDASATVDQIEETVTAGSSSLSYDATTGRYNYVWKTEKSWTGCRQLQVQLVDGTMHTAIFKFTK